MLSLGDEQITKWHCSGGVGTKFDRMANTGKVRFTLMDAGASQLMINCHMMPRLQQDVGASGCRIAVPECYGCSQTRVHQNVRYYPIVAAPSRLQDVMNGSSIKGWWRVAPS